MFPSASRRGSNHITFTHPSIALVVLCPSLPLLPLHPSSPASPLTAREPAPSAGQGTRLYRTRTCTLQYTQAHGLTRGQAHQGKRQQSSAGKPAVDSRRRPLRSLPRSPRNTSLSPSQSLVPFPSRQPYATDSVSLAGKAARPRPTAPARQARPSRARSPQGKAEILPISSSWVQEEGLGDFRQISIFHLALCLCSASQSRPWRLLKHTQHSNTHAQPAALYPAVTVSPMCLPMCQSSCIGSHTLFPFLCCIHAYPPGYTASTCVYTLAPARAHVPGPPHPTSQLPCPCPSTHAPISTHGTHASRQNPIPLTHSVAHSPTRPLAHLQSCHSLPCALYPLALRLSCLLSRGLHLELTLRHLLAHA